MISKRTIKTGIAITIIGVVITAAIMMFSDLSEVQERIVRGDARFYPVLLALIPVNFLIKYVRYVYYLRQTNNHVKSKDKITSLFSSFVMVITPGKLGEMLLRGYLLRCAGYEIQPLVIYAMTLADRLTEGIAMALLAVLLTMIGGRGLGVWPLTIVMCAMLLFAVLLQEKRLVTRLFGGIGRLGSKAKRAADVCKEAYLQAYAIFEFWPMTVSIILGIMSWCCEGGVIYYMGRALGQNISLLQSILAVTISGLLGALSMIPGGVGISDGTTLGVLLHFGADKAAAGAMTIVSRFSVMWFGVVAGAVCLVVSGNWRKIEDVTQD